MKINVPKRTFVWTLNLAAFFVVSASTLEGHSRGAAPAITTPAVCLACVAPCKCSSWPHDVCNQTVDYRCECIAR